MSKRLVGYVNVLSGKFTSVQELAAEQRKKRSVCYGCDGDRNRYHLGTVNPHECPYRSEINDDKKFKCNCCKRCQEECAANI